MNYQQYFRANIKRRPQPLNTHQLAIYADLLSALKKEAIRLRRLEKMLQRGGK